MRCGSISGSDTDLLCGFWQDAQEWILLPLMGKNSRLALWEQCQKAIFVELGLVALFQ